MLWSFENVVQHVKDMLALLLLRSRKDSNRTSADSQVGDEDCVDIALAASDLELLVRAILVKSVTALLDASTALENAHLLL